MNYTASIHVSHLQSKAGSPSSSLNIRSATGSAPIVNGERPENTCWTKSESRNDHHRKTNRLSLLGCRDCYGCAVNPLPFIYSDGGRKSAHFRGEADDCVTRAISIAAQIQYREIYHAIAERAASEVHIRGRMGQAATVGLGSHPRTGVWKCTYKPFIENKLGWVWTPTMQLGKGCRVHLRAGELPMGRLIVKVSKHLVAVIDGIIYDTSDPSRDGNRCVYGYWREKP